MFVETLALMEPTLVDLVNLARCNVLKGVLGEVLFVLGARRELLGPEYILACLVELNDVGRLVGEIIELSKHVLVDSVVVIRAG